MLNKFYSIQPSARILLAAMVLLSAVSAIAQSTNVIPSRTFMYAVQPAMAIGTAVFAMRIAGGMQDRVRHRGDKAFLVGSVLAIWFVLYFLSGLMTTYVHNSLVGSLRGILINVWSFGVVAYAIEYSRHIIMLVVSRRNVIWFGAVVASVLAVQQMNFSTLAQAHDAVAFIKLCISGFIPAILSSFLLTYLAITGGFAAMLVYRLGLVAITILPPIIPKYDWYLQGVTLILWGLPCLWRSTELVRTGKSAVIVIGIMHHAPTTSCHLSC